MGRHSCCSIDHIDANVGATLGLQWVLFQILVGEIDSIWAAFIGILRAKYTAWVQAGQIPAQWVFLGTEPV